MKVIFQDDNHIMPDGSEWELIVYDKEVLDLNGNLVNSHSLIRKPTTDELIEEQIRLQKESELADLRTVIADKKLLDMDCTAEQVELRNLLGI